MSKGFCLEVNLRRFFFCKRKAFLSCFFTKKRLGLDKGKRVKNARQGRVRPLSRNLFLKAYQGRELRLGLIQERVFRFRFCIRTVLTTMTS